MTLARPGLRIIYTYIVPTYIHEIKKMAMGGGGQTKPPAAHTEADRKPNHMVDTGQYMQADRGKPEGMELVADTEEGCAGRTAAC